MLPFEKHIPTSTLAGKRDKKMKATLSSTKTLNEEMHKRL